MRLYPRYDRECGPSWKFGFAIAVIKCIDIGVYHRRSDQTRVRQTKKQCEASITRGLACLRFQALYKRVNVPSYARWISTRCFSCFAHCMRERSIYNMHDTVKFWMLRRDLHKNSFASVSSCISNYNGKHVTRDAFIKWEKSELRNFLFRIRVRIRIYSKVS